MPAVLAHWAVAREVARRFINNNKNGYRLFQGATEDRYEQISRYLYLGANGPDLPYFYDVDAPGIMAIAGTMGKSKYADLYHYNKQGEFILQLVLVARKITDVAHVAHRDRTMAYTLGHATHLAADAMMHPYVNCFAGAYHQQKIEDIHKTSEGHQDSWVAKTYLNRTSIFDGDPWKNCLPLCFQSSSSRLIELKIVGYTQVCDEAKEVLKDISTAFANTYNYKEPLFGYFKNSYENFYDHAIDKGYRQELIGQLPRIPHEKLVQHEKLTFNYDNRLTKAIDLAEKLCEEVISLYDKDNEDYFRSKVKNWNMDTGYWIDVKLDGNKLKIIWRHTWC
jgi:hypothetical protein